MKQWHQNLVGMQEKFCLQSAVSNCCQRFASLNTYIFCLFVWTTILSQLNGSSFKASFKQRLLKNLMHQIRVSSFWRAPKALQQIGKCFLNYKLARINQFGCFTYFLTLSWMCCYQYVVMCFSVCDCNLNVYVWGPQTMRAHSSLNSIFPGIRKKN